MFAFKINYNDYNALDQGDIEPQALYNGNISATYWQTANDNVLRKYNYSYDHLNRLKVAVYIKPGSNTRANNYGEEVSYDKNGNILSLERNGGLDGAVNQIDFLEYSYHNVNKNQLTKVFDSSNSPLGFRDDGDGISASDPEDDFSYDANGNLTGDANKEIREIKYNHLNLPTEIKIGNYGATIYYFYTATGEKREKRVIDPVSFFRPTTLYLQGFQYKNGVLDFFPHAEGYVKKASPQVGGNISVEFGDTPPPPPNPYSYVFNYTDHLGNVRLSYSDKNKNGVIESTTEIVEENNYYPFGLKHEGYTDNLNLSYKYKYNGKEYQDELGLNVYDYQARVYDPASVTFWQIDPKAEQGRRWSPYVFAMDNPVYYMDPDGMWPTDPVKGFIARAKAYVKQKAKDVAYAGAALAVSTAKNYVNQKIDNGKKAVKEFFSSDSSSSTSKSSGGVFGYGVQFWVGSNNEKMEGIADPETGKDRSKIGNSDASGVVAVSETMNAGTGKKQNDNARSSYDAVSKSESDVSGSKKSTMENNLNPNLEEKKVEMSYRSTTGTSSRTGNMYLPDFEVKDTVVPESKANEVYDSLEKKFQQNYEKQLKENN